MEKPKFSAGSVAKKTLAVVSSAALLMSCGVTTTLTSIAPTGIVAQAATNIATKLKILDLDLALISILLHIVIYFDL